MALTLALVCALAGGIATGVTFAAPGSPTAPTDTTSPPGDTLPPPTAKPLGDPNAIEVAPGLPAPPAVSAPGWAVYDGVDGTLLAGQATGTERPMASLAKLVTTLVVIARTTGTEQVTASKAAQDSGDGSEIAMKAGQKFTVESLLQAMLVHSTNDAAVALSEYISGDEASFVKLMQQTITNMKLEHTTLTNATGLDEPTPPMSTAFRPVRYRACCDERRTCAHCGCIALGDHCAFRRRPDHAR